MSNQLFRAFQHAQAEYHLAHRKLVAAEDRLATARAAYVAAAREAKPTLVTATGGEVGPGKPSIPPRKGSADR